MMGLLPKLVVVPEGRPLPPAPRVIVADAVLAEELLELTGAVVLEPEVRVDTADDPELDTFEVELDAVLVVPDPGDVTGVPD